MTALDDSVFLWWWMSDESHFDAQCNQPEVKQRWKGRGAFVVVKRAVVIQADPLGQAVAQKGESTGQLIVGCAWFGAMCTYLTAYFGPADQVADVDQTD